MAGRAVRVVHGLALTVALATSVPAQESSFFFQEPVGQNVHPGDSAVFVVRPKPNLGLQFQWYLNGTAIAGATDTLLILRDVKMSDAGSQFACLAFNQESSQLSQTAALRVVRHTSQLITLTGDLSRSDGSKVGDAGEALLTMAVRLYTKSTGGDAVYSEEFSPATGSGIKVDDGRFTVRLGEGVSDAELSTAIAKHPTLFVQFELGEDPTREILEPRLPFTAVPYALSGKAATLKGVGDPNMLKLSAPVGTFFVDETRQTTWIRTLRAWVLAD